MSNMNGGSRASLIAAWNSESDPTGLIGAANQILTGAIDGDRQWLQVSPYGEFPNQVGLQVFRLEDAQVMVADFNSLAARLDRNFRGLPFYVGHPDAAPDQYPDSKAYGWIKAIEARNDGLWSAVRWSKAGREMIEEGHYQYVSPFWQMRAANGRRGAFNPVVLTSVGLTNSPNIPGGNPVGANTKKQDHMTKEQKAKVIKALALAEDASDEQIITALNEQRKKADDDAAALVVANNEKARLAAELTTTKGQVTAANSTSATAEEQAATLRKQRDGLELTAAVNEGRITEAQRADWAGRLVTDYDKHSTELRALKPAVNTKSKTSGMGNRKGESVAPAGQGDIRAINAAVAAYRKTHECDYAAAFNAVQADPAHAALFAAPEEGED